MEILTVDSWLKDRVENIQGHACANCPYLRMSFLRADMYPHLFIYMCNANIYKQKGFYSADEMPTVCSEKPKSK